MAKKQHNKAQDSPRPASNRQDTEETLRQQKELLSVTLASIGDGVVVTDRQGLVTFLNGEAERLTGWTNQEAQGQPLAQVFRIINEHTREPVENPVEKVLRLGTIVGLANHTVLIAKGGTETPIDDSGAPVRSADGQVHGVVLVFRDFSQKKDAHKALTRLAAIVESSEDAIVSKSLDGKILTWNAAAERMLGYAASEIIGQPITVLVPPEHAEEEARIIEQLRRGDRVESFDTVRLAKGGRRIDVSLSVSPLRDEGGRVVGASKIMRDISSRKEAEESLRSSEAKLRSQSVALEAAANAIAILRRDGMIEWVNEAFCRLTGYSFAEACGANPRVLKSGRHPPEFYQAMWESVLAGKVWHGELTNKRKDGTLYDEEMTITPVRDATGTITHFIAIKQDITVRKQAEESLLADAQRLGAILNAQRDIAAANMDSVALAQLVLEHMSRLTGAEGASLEVAEGDEMVYAAATGLAERFVGLRLKTAGSLSGLCLTSGQQQRSDDTENDARVDREACRRIGLRSMVLIPLRYGEHSFGVLKLMSSRVAAFGVATEQILGLMGEFLSATIGRRRAEESLRSSEVKYRGLFENIEEMVTVYEVERDANGRIVEHTLREANRAFLRSVGVSSIDEVRGKTFSQIFGKAWSDEHLPAVQKALDTGEVQVTEVYRPESGRYYITSVVRMDAKTYLGTGWDITDRKRSEEALRQSHERLKKVLEVEAVGVMFWDLSTGRLVDANDTFLKLMGYSRSDIETAALTWQKFTPPEYHEVSLAEIRKFQATGRVGPYEKEYLRKDGTRQWLLFSGGSLGNSSCVEFCVDISDRKRAEAALRDSEEQFRVLTQNLNSAVALIDERGAFSIVNPAFR